MKIAFIMLAHKNPNQINLLINKLDSNDNDFYIHLDAKSEIENQICRKDNVILLPLNQRVDVKWGQLSMVRATLHLLDFVFQSKKFYDYIWLISGQDFPIKSVNEIQKYLKSHNGTNFINIITPKDKDFRKYSKRDSLYYPKWIMGRSYLIRILKIFYQILGSFFLGKRQDEFQVYYGSQWWTLTYSCCKKIYDIIKNNEKILQHYQNSLVPDESLFQTVFMMTEFKEKVFHSLTYTDWDGSMNHPKTLTMNDLNKIKRIEDYFIARKFDSKIDNAIINYLVHKL